MGKHTAFTSVADRVGTDVTTLIQWMERSGMLERAAKGSLIRGTREFQILASLTTLMDLLIRQCEPDEAKTFDLYETLVARVPNLNLHVTPDFLQLYTYFRAHHVSRFSEVAKCTDMQSYRRVQTYLQSLR